MHPCPCGVGEAERERERESMGVRLPYRSSLFQHQRPAIVGITKTPFMVLERSLRFPLHFSVSPLKASSTPSPSPLLRHSEKAQTLEELIEKVIYRCRFLTLLGVMGSLIGSFLCFIKGSSYVVQAFAEYMVKKGTVILQLVEALDLYLLGTVMLVFGMGLYELFVSNLGTAANSVSDRHRYRSNLFGMFTLKERPKWLNIKTVNELKTKLGHVIVMLLLIGVFEKSKKAAINSPLDLLCFAASVLLSSSCLFLLSKLN